jgi:hypothetical protein
VRPARAAWSARTPGTETDPTTASEPKRRRFPHNAGSPTLGARASLAWCPHLVHWFGAPVRRWW